MRAVRLYYDSPRQVENWSRQHAEGEVPGRWLYGLDRLGDDPRVSGLEVAYTGDWSVARRVRYALRGLLSLPRASSDLVNGPLTLSWDERHTARLLAAGRPSGELWSGLIWATDDQHEGTQRLRTFLNRRVLRELNGVWVLSSGQLEAARTYLGPNQKVKLVTFGVDAAFFHPRPNLVPEKQLVLSVGNDRDRDTATLYAAMQHVAEMAPSVDILVQTRSALEPPPGVTRVPRMPHATLRNLYQRATAVVLPTKPNLHFSGMTAALEAMACGAIPIVSNTPGAADYVSNGATGYLTPAGNAEELAAATLHLLGDETLRLSMSHAARAAVEANYTHAHFVHSLAEAVFDAER